ncbi:RNA deprotection pyrophosphohydrolase [Halalkalibacter oceani]|uniref:Nucleoside triphosphatase YtkD n=1 Tax=Halalkalibacter oceani TaxID=1653776 RepID=A0A9X2DPZ4_9BACI|nr:nucleoside triphosphatase YtkD [Halalkalibacter oceani]MCM3714941.1 nucleoside triphosphatase YtkD [Halalkalibacter oceani]
MKQFIDQRGCQVRIVFGEEASLSPTAKHVWIVCRYQGKWLLTNHRKRGWEFPGGKVEERESAVEAAKREVYEETGARLEAVHYLGQYEVACQQETMYKNIYFATVKELQQKDDYLETAGPVLLESFPAAVAKDERFSFIMQDQVLPLVLAEIVRKGLLAE